MPQKRPLIGSGRQSWFEKRRSSNGGSSRTDASSSSALGTPITHTTPHSKRSNGPAFSRVVPAPRISVPPSTPVLPSHPTQNRVSLRAPNSRDSYASSFANGALEEEEEQLIQSLENSDAWNEVILAVDMKERGTIGCAYYVAKEEKLCLMQDIKLAGLDVVDTLKLHAQPTIILISSKAGEALEDYLSKEARAHNQGDEESKYIMKL